MALKQASRLLMLRTPLGDDALVLTAFSGREEISRLFCFQLEMISDNNAIKAADIVGQNVTWGVKLKDKPPRHFNGFVSRFFAGDEDKSGRRQYRAEVVPWLWFLTRTADCRIFQDKTVVEIIKQIFQDLGFSDFETAQTQGSHPKRTYCVQYRETDFNFVSRLMEEEGIFYFFKHQEGKHILVLGDQKSAYVDCVEKEVDYPTDFGSRTFEDFLTQLGTPLSVPHGQVGADRLQFRPASRPHRTYAQPAADDAAADQDLLAGSGQVRGLRLSGRVRQEKRRRRR